MKDPGKIIEGRWVFNKDSIVLEYLDLNGLWIYEVDLETCKSSAGLLDWIFQVHQKPWLSDEAFRQMVEALHSILDPQANLCSFGESKEIKDIATMLSQDSQIAK